MCVSSLSFVCSSHDDRSDLKVSTHQTDIRERAAMKPDCHSASHLQSLGHKASVKHTAETTADKLTRDRKYISAVVQTFGLMKQSFIWGRCH